MSDEPILNNFFIDHLTPIHRKYNTLLYKYELDTLDKKHNIHFNGTQKPWNSREFLHYFNEFSATLEKYGIAKGSVSILKLFSLYEKIRLDAEKIATL
jgi:lipopolysaccharide biosynthesis glycosyltransferase